ncbi:MAG TPA: Mth938-like domain-containing protein [Burkholderiaceae bacterium]|nr:Mth938-like domain-containing protein [Burkholderiaceae bacterium]
MKLHADPPTTLNTVTAYGPGFIEINSVRYTKAVRLYPDQPPTEWSVGSFDALRAEDFAALLDARPEVVLFGTGARQCFPHPRLSAPLAHAHVGFEVMDTQAACRTYNILVAEGRRVLAVLLLDS